MRNSIFWQRRWSRTTSVEEFELVSGGGNVCGVSKVAVDLDVSGSRIPFARLSVRGLRLNLHKFCGHVLAFSHLANDLVINEDVETFPIDPYDANDVCRFETALRSCSVHKVFDGSLREIDGSVETVFRHLPRYSGLDVEACD